MSIPLVQAAITVSYFLAVPNGTVNLCRANSAYGLHASFTKGSQDALRHAKVLFFAVYEYWPLWNAAY
jgi:hypothetical protein